MLDPSKTYIWIDHENCKISYLTYIIFNIINTALYLQKRLVSMHQYTSFNNIWIPFFFHFLVLLYVDLW